MVLMLVEQSNALSIESRISNLHEHSKQARGGKSFDRKSNGLGGGGKSAIPHPARPCANRTFGKKEFRSRRIIKVPCSAFNLAGRPVTVCLMVWMIYRELTLILF